MLKLNPGSGSYPWFVMGIGAVLFSIGAFIGRAIITKFQLTMIFGLTSLFTLLPFIGVLLLLDILLFKGKHWLKMGLVGLIITIIQLAYMYLSAPLIMVPWFGTFISRFFIAYIFFMDSLIAGAIFSAFMYGRKEVIRCTAICALISLPFCIVNEVLYSKASELTGLGDYATADLLWSLIRPLGFLAMGVGLSLCIGIKEYRDSKRMAEIPATR